MNRKVKRYDPINSDGTCGMCIEDADYGAYVEYADYAALEAELAKFREELERRAVDGWKLVPVEPTPEMAAQTAYNGTHYSDPFDFEDFKKDYAAMLAAAPRQPDGFVPMPLVPTQAMMQAADHFFGTKDWYDATDSAGFIGLWRVLLAAAPSAPDMVVSDETVQGVNQQLLEALNGMLLHIREPESENEFQWPEHFKKQKAAFAAARAAIAIAAARKGEGK